MADVKVALALADAGPMATLIPKTVTDSEGRFSFSPLEFGAFWLSTEKELDGYPNTRMDLYRSRRAVEVALDAAHPVSEVTLVIGPKAGWALW